MWPEAVLQKKGRWQASGKAREPGFWSWADRERSAAGRHDSEFEHAASSLLSGGAEFHICRACLHENGRCVNKLCEVAEYHGESPAAVSYLRGINSLRCGHRHVTLESNA